MQAGLMKTSNKQVMQAQPEPIIAGSDVRFVHAHTHTQTNVLNLSSLFTLQSVMLLFEWFKKGTRDKVHGK